MAILILVDKEEENEMRVTYDKNNNRYSFFISEPSDRTIHITLTMSEVKCLVNHLQNLIFK